jgi:hypothetical protein
MLLEARMLRKTFGPVTDDVRRDGKNCLLRSFIINTLHQLLVWSKIMSGWGI